MSWFLTGCGVGITYKETRGITMLVPDISNEAIPMRYVKVIVQDRTENDRADTVKLYFFQRDPDLPDELMHQAVAFDVTADGAVDFQSTGDIDFNGASTLRDRRLLKTFANEALKLSWFNRGEGAGRSLNFYVSRYDELGTPREVRSDFFQRSSSGGKDKLVYSSTAGDQDCDGGLDPLAPDDQFELFDTVDQQTIHALSKLYLRFNWH
ncbi:hypothetical protein [Pseudomonas synxantha]|uniref:hypothetical protein n=1 Tax=Pseudomonas synxantha TaxID=47883 RepID=UPI00278CCE7F|nr:hypothetical protein [Pseudomonas synxantha]MDQ0977874.1 hypothetical protein [Pseudomonas synxantha]